MTPSKINRRIVGDRLAWIERMVGEINSLPLRSYDVFVGDSRNVWAAESCLRRALEALFDMGRHFLAKGFGLGVSEYKEIAKELERREILSHDDSQLMQTLAGYRNRLVHFYHEVKTQELYEICKSELGDISTIREAYVNWLKAHPEMIDETL